MHRAFPVLLPAQEGRYYYGRARARHFIMSIERPYPPDNVFGPPPTTLFRPSPSTSNENRYPYDR